IDRVQLTDGGSSLTIINVTRSDQGPFRCRVSNPVSTVTSDPVHLSISLPKSFFCVFGKQEKTNFLNFRKLVFSCFPKTQKNDLGTYAMNSVVTESDRVHLTDGGSSLVINATRFDQGSFRCRVANPVSNGTSEPVNLTISYGPENTNVFASPSQQYYTTGSDINLTCSVESRPPAQFQWFVNGDQLPDTGSELRLMNVQMSHSGNYSCETFNSITLISQKSQHSVVSVMGNRGLPSRRCL
uniref:Ig-like domain-containing protein n=1 Tax=Pundamilia nyererei TaxID=303518 RepID=A0A3B4H568_9CICH